MPCFRLRGKGQTYCCGLSGELATAIEKSASDTCYKLCASALTVVAYVQDYGSNFADLEVRSLQPTESSTDDTHAQFSPQFESAW